MTTNRRRITLVLVAALAVGVGASAWAGDSADEKKPKPYGLIFGTAFGPDDRPMYGVRVTIHPEGKKHPNWELLSDHHGEFAQRVPPGPGDYVVTGVIEIIPAQEGPAHGSRKKRLKGEAKVHVDDQERRDFNLHMKE